MIDGDMLFVAKVSFILLLGRPNINVFLVGFLGIVLKVFGSNGGISVIFLIKDITLCRCFDKAGIVNLAFASGKAFEL